MNHRHRLHDYYTDIIHLPEMIALDFLFSLVWCHMMLHLTCVNLGQASKQFINISVCLLHLFLPDRRPDDHHKHLILLFRFMLSFSLFMHYRFTVFYVTFASFFYNALMSTYLIFFSKKTVLGCIFVFIFYSELYVFN